MDTYRLYSRLWTLSKVQKIKVWLKSSLIIWVQLYPLRSKTSSGLDMFKYSYQKLYCSHYCHGFSDHCTSKIWIGLSDVVISIFFKFIPKLLLPWYLQDQTLVSRDATLILPDKKRDETDNLLLNCTVHKNMTAKLLLSSTTF